MLKELFRIRETKAEARRKWDDTMSGVAIDGYVTCQVYGAAIKEVLTSDSYANWDVEHIKKLLIMYSDQLIENGNKYKETYDELLELRKKLQ